MNFQYLVIICLTSSFFYNCSEKKESSINLEDLEQRAKSHIKSKSYLEAVSYYSQLIEFDSGSSEYYFQRGYCLSQLEKFELAATDFQTSAEAGYREFDSYYALASIFILAKPNDSLAETYLLKILDLNPESNEVLELSEMYAKSLMNRDGVDL